MIALVQAHHALNIVHRTSRDWQDGDHDAVRARARCRRQRLVLVNAMIPKAGETAGEWWDAVGWFAAAQASADQDGRPTPDVTDLDTLFFHDLPPELADIMRSDPDAAAEGPAVFGQPWPLDAWPGVATTVLSGRDDRFFPVAFQQRVARGRLGLEVEVLPGGHLIELSQPIALADRLTGVTGETPG